MAAQGKLLSWVPLFVLRVQTMPWWRSGRLLTGGSTPHSEDTTLRSRTSPSTWRTHWSPPAAVTKPSASGAFEPAPRWPSCRDTVDPLPPYRCVSLIRTGQSSAWSETGLMRGSGDWQGSNHGNETLSAVSWFLCSTFIFNQCTAKTWGRNFRGKTNNHALNTR